MTKKIRSKVTEVLKNLSEITLLMTQSCCAIVKFILEGKTIQAVPKYSIRLQKKEILEESNDLNFEQIYTKSTNIYNTK